MLHNMTTNLITEQARDYVQSQMLEKLSPNFVFHNFEHTEELTEVCASLSEAAGLPEEERTVLLLAATFLDAGYTRQTEAFQDASAEMAAEYLKQQGRGVEEIQAVTALLQHFARKEPASTLAKMLHDAYWSFLGRKRFFRRGDLLRLEWEAVKGETYSLYEWNEKLLDIQLETKYYTPWAQEAFTKRRNKNIADQREEIAKAHRQTVRKKTGKDFGRGVDTIYRVTLRNHINLSSIADGKANMIISINTLVLSILLTAGSASFSLATFSNTDNLFFIIPVILLMLSSLAAIVFAVFSAIPQTAGVEFTREDVKQHRVSLLYFGNFLKLERDEFIEYLRDLKEDQEVLYDDLSRDLYNLGAVLKRKYRLLTIAYRIFVAGLVISVSVFLVMYLFI